jgi:hypothetical protein
MRYIYKTTNSGVNWISVTAMLPLFSIQYFLFHPQPVLRQVGLPTRRFTEQQMQAITGVLFQFHLATLSIQFIFLPLPPVGDAELTR